MKTVSDPPTVTVMVAAEAVIGISEVIGEAKRAYGSTKSEEGEEGEGGAHEGRRAGKRPLFA